MNDRPQNRNDALNACVALVILSVLGLSLTQNPGITGHIPSVVYPLGGLLAILCGFRVRNHQSWHPAVLCSLALVAWSALTSLTGLDASRAEQALRALILSTSVFVGLALLDLKRKHKNRLTALSLLLIVASTIFAWVTEYQSPESWQRLAGHFTNPNTLAAIILIGLCLSRTLDQSTNLIPSPILAVISVFLLSSLVATLSRSGFVGFLLAAALGIAPQIKRLGFKKVALPLLALAIPLGIYLGFSSGFKPLAKRLASTSTSKYDIPLRLLVMKGSLQCFGERPFLGSGPGNFPLAFQEIHPVDHQMTEYVNSAHNDPLEFLVETGLIGLLLWLLLNGSLLFLAWKSGRLSVAWLAGGTAGLFLMSQFNFLVPALTTSLWLFFLFGLTALGCSPKRNISLTPNWNVGLSLLLILAGCWTLLSGSCDLVAMTYLKHSQIARERGDLATGLAQLNRAIRWAPKNPKLRLFRAEVHQELARKAPGMLEPASLDLKAAAQLSPRDLEILGSCTLYFAGEERLETALEYALQAHRYAPYHDKSRARLAAIYSLGGDLESAAETLIPRAGRFTPALAQTIYQLERGSPGEGFSKLSTLEPATLTKLTDRIRKEALKAGDKDMLSRLHDLRQPIRAQNSLRGELQRATDLRALGEVTEAQRVLVRAVAPSNSKKDGYSEALAFWSQLTGAKSLPSLKEHLDLHPKDIDVRIALSDLLPASEATKLLSRGLELSPGDRRLNHQMGVVFEREGMDDLAENYYRESKGKKR